MYSKYIKRVLDVLFSVVLLILLSPIFLVVAVAIKLDSKGPVIFKQIRSGKNGVPFKLYKFRSMSASNDVYNSSEEDQVTKVGRVIRKLSLDELPQLINIIKGDMSFIGPRPWILEYAENFNKHQMRRLDVLPGITGLAQCSGRNNLSIKERINIDIYYAILLISINVFLNYFYFFIKKKHLIGTLLFQLTWSLTPHSPTAAFAWVCRTTNHLDFNIGRSYI